MDKVRFETSDLLLESFKALKKKHGVDLSKQPGRTLEIVVNDDTFNYYVESLLEPFTSAKDRMALRNMFNGTRKTLMENMNSRFGIAPYEVLSMPLIPVFYPRLVAKDLVTFITTDKPEIIKPIMRASFKRFGDSTIYNAPAMNRDMSIGPQYGVPANLDINIPGSTDVLATLGLTSDVSHLEKNFIITHLIDAASNEVRVDAIPDVDGNIYINTVINGNPEVVSGHVDFLNGVVTLTNLNGVAVKARIVGSASVEENTVSTKVEFKIDKIRIPIRDREMEASYSIQDKMDVKSLYDVDAEAMLLNLMAQQIALDIDNEILRTLTGVAYNVNQVPATHIAQFNKNIPAGSNYAFGPKQWHAQIESVFNELAGIIYNDTNIGLANTVAANSIDAAIIRDIETYNVDFGHDGKSTIGYTKATINKNAYTVLDSNVQEKSKVLMLYKPESSDDEEKTTFYFVMHTPGIVIPYPKNNRPSFSVLTRYGTALVQPKSIGVVEII